MAALCEQGAHSVQLSPGGASRVNESEVVEAIENEATTAREIAEFVGKSRSNTTRHLKRMAEDAESTIVREENPTGPGYIYGVEVADEAVDDTLPVFGDREEYTFADAVPNPSSGDYIQAKNEKDEIEAIVDARETTEQLPRFRLKGPPGTGKTTLATDIAATRQWPLINIQFTAQMRDSELFGTPLMIGGESVWVDGPIVRALLCSRERPVIVVLDEVNRAPFHRKSSLQQVLDHRCTAEIQLRGGEEIVGKATNFVTVATMNEGPEYETYPIDPAEKRRHGNTWEVPYLGLVDAEREAELVASETTAPVGLATVMVKSANRIRNKATADQTSPIQKGIATSALLEWARTATAYDEAGLSSPVTRSARTAVVDPRYSDRAAEVVEAEILEVVRDARHHQAAGAGGAESVGDHA